MPLLATEPTVDTIAVGTFTFLFTDIEGSSRLWETETEAMRRALIRHDALLRDIVARHDGSVFKSAGDGICAAFARASDAVAAAIEAQCTLQTTTWETSKPILVRMGLHSGNVEIRDNDFFGRPVNRVARLMSAGHGGQILVSHPVWEATQWQLPENTSYQDMGEHRLRDLLKPEHIFQIRHPDLPTDFAPLKTLDQSAISHNLPQQLTSFIGRAEEMDALREQLRQWRLVTLTGSGGVGKTRLSLQYGADALEQYPDGVYLIELAPLHDPTLIVTAIARTIGLRLPPGSDLSSLTEACGERRMLLILDNCEHVVQEAARVAHHLLQQCPNLRILASSRERLNLPGEKAFRVPPLSLPEPGTASVEHLHRYEAARLFVERATASQPTFQVTHGNVAAVSQICHRLDGIPLAIELAAARVRALNIQHICDRLGDRFRLLTGGDRTALPRQQTLRALIDWSYDLLNAEERRLLMRLSTLAGGTTLETAEKVCAADGIEDWQVLDLLTSLVDKSLVLFDDTATPPRYRMLSTIRQYAYDRLVESGAADDAWERHVDHFVAMAIACYHGMEGPNQREVLHDNEIELENYRAALDWCEAHGNDVAWVERALGITGHLWHFWIEIGYTPEARQRCLAALQLPATVATPIIRQALAHLGLGTVVHAMDDEDLSETHLLRALELYVAVNDEVGQMYSYNNLANVFSAKGDMVKAAEYYERSLDICRRQGDDNALGIALANLGTLYANRDEFARARDLYEEALVYFRRMGNKMLIAHMIGLIAWVSLQQEDLEAACIAGEESLAMRREVGNLHGILASLSVLSPVYQGLGRTAEADRTLLEFLRGARDTEVKNHLMTAMLDTAEVALRCDNVVLAVHLVAANETLAQGGDNRLQERMAKRRHDYREKVREKIGAEREAELYQEGRTREWRGSVEEALELLATVVAASTP